MILIPQEGPGKLKFGMKRQDVENLYGKPDQEFRDDEDNVIWVFNSEKMRLTFYKDEDYRFGYVICSHPEMELFGQRVIGKEVSEVKERLKQHGIDAWEREEFDITVNDFNEKNWLILQSEFGEVVKVESGAVINERDEFVWKGGWS